MTTTTTTSTTTGLTGSMLIDSLLAATATFTRADNARTGLKRFAKRHGLEADQLEVVDLIGGYRIQRRPRPVVPAPFVAPVVPAPLDYETDATTTVATAAAANVQEAARKPAKPRKGGKSRGRPNTKGAAVLTMLAKGWTPMSDITKATGWLKHSARAFLCRIDEKAHGRLESERVDGGSRYRLVRK